MRRPVTLVIVVSGYMVTTVILVTGVNWYMKRIVTVITVVCKYVEQTTCVPIIEVCRYVVTGHLSHRCQLVHGENGYLDYKSQQVYGADNSNLGYRSVCGLG